MVYRRMPPWRCLGSERPLTKEIAAAQPSLGVIYHSGQGAPQDYATAISWYQKAAEQGYADAQVNLGAMFHGGEGVAQDYGAAVYWYLMAAEQGDAAAQYNLGLMYAQGHGVQQDYVQAHM